MTRVFDASAVLAALFLEPGGDKVVALWAEGLNLITAVNLAEIVTKLNDRGMTDAEVATVLEGIPLTVLEFGPADALATGLLRKSTRKLGLSLGDRACLAAGRARNADIVTAERSWKKLEGYRIAGVR